MALTLATLVVAVIISLVRGGRVRRIEHVNLVASWLLFVGLGMQVAVDVVTAREWLTNGALTYALLLASQLGIVTWLWLNRFRPGLPLVLIGTLLNAIVMAANGAMPVDVDAVAAAGGDLGPLVAGKHVAMTPGTNLAFLADIYVIPILKSIVSIGDIVLTAGLIPLVHHLMTYLPAAERRGGARSALEDAAAG